jgi:hypothetical protein
MNSAAMAWPRPGDAPTMSIVWANCFVVSRSRETQMRRSSLVRSAAELLGSTSTAMAKEI